MIERIRDADPYLARAYERYEEIARDKAAAHGHMGIGTQNGYPENYLEPIWNSHGTNGLPVSLLYFIEGESDDMGPVIGSYYGLFAWDQVFKPGENLEFIQINGIGHNETEWLTALYDAAQLFFR